jgi:hypothetical protein
MFKNKKEDGFNFKRDPNTKLVYVDQVVENAEKCSRLLIMRKSSLYV